MQQLFQTWDPPRRLLVLHDLSPQAGHATWRAGMIARDHGAVVSLLHVANDAANAGEARRTLEALAIDLAGQLGVQVDVNVDLGDPVAAVVRACAGMVVLGAQRRNVLRDWIFGSPAERLIRLGGCPVLVVKKPANSPYRRVLVPVDFGPAAGRAVSAATLLTQGAPVEVFHSLTVRDEVTMRAVDLPEAVIRRQRQRNADRARARINELAGNVPGARRSVVPSIAYGHPSRMVLEKEQAMSADLVVIGKRRRGVLADFLLGSVTRRVLAAGRSDVLVLTEADRGRAATLAFDQLPA